MLCYDRIDDCLNAELLHTQGVNPRHVLDDVDPRDLQLSENPDIDVRGKVYSGTSE